jgi:transposase-like protein
MTIRNELIDELLAGQDPASVMRQDGLLGDLKKALLNRLMAAEFEHHMTQDRATGESRNYRNGSTRKRVLTDDNHVEVTIPRDREARFDPVLIGKYQRRLPGFDDKVISLYTRGMSTREIQGHLEEIYGAEVSPQLISTVTDAVTAEVAEWQSRPLEPLYPVVFFDAIRVKVRDQGTVCNKAVYLALGITPDGRKHILGLWIDPNEGAKFTRTPFRTMTPSATCSPRSIRSCSKPGSWPGSTTCMTLTSRSGSRSTARPRDARTIEAKAASLCIWCPPGRPARDWCWGNRRRRRNRMKSLRFRCC